MPILDVKISDQSAPIFVVESRITANTSKQQDDTSTERLQGETLGQLLSRSLSISESYSLEKYPEKVVYKSQVSLSNLPNDLLLRIFSLCEARTISKLRQCCKGFYELSTEQVVWLSVLKRTCTELNLPIPSFPESGFSNSDIELLATAWIRFESVLRQAKDGQPLPHKMVHLLDINIEGPILSFDQSPDGRFLFVVQTVGIRVWSLQTSSPTLVASFELEIPGDCWKNLCVGTESNSSYLMYLLVSTRSHGLNEWLCLRFKYPMGEHREAGVELLSQLDRLRFSARRWHSWSTSLTAPLLITCFDHSSGGKYYLVWDPVADSCVTWSADVKDTSTNPIVS
ncbi:hypothetical protein DL96DRAFT_119234 [Flagelloscypha sp. PMI_526]|nr:hypothetical protein DL96DRAFT_119234 [Flagelloscypha sp. PMI_526]